MSHFLKIEINWMNFFLQKSLGEKKFALILFHLNWTESNRMQIRIFRIFENFFSEIHKKRN